MAGGVKNPLFGPFYGGTWPQDTGLQSIPAMPAPQIGASGQGGPNYMFGGLLTYEKPIVEFPADITIGINTLQTLQAGTDLPRNCVGVRFIGVVDNVFVSINGGGARRVLNNDVITGCIIKTLQVLTDGTGTATVQAVGTGD